MQVYAQRESSVVALPPVVAITFLVSMLVASGCATVQPSEEAQLQDTMEELARDLGQLSAVVSASTRPEGDTKQQGEKDPPSAAQPWVGAGVEGYASGGRPPSIFIVGAAPVQGLSAAEQLAYFTTMENVRRLRRKYEANKYVRITGFTVEIGIPPSVSIDFEFR